MWDYDKLFAEGNVIGISPAKNEVINLVCSKFNHNINGFRDFYSNNDLSYENIKIQYIIRLDEHGNVVDKLFDRDRDMPEPMPELETGMFALIFNYDHTETRLGYINAEKNIIIYQTGGWDYINENKDDILKVYSNNCNCFDGCSEHRVIWRNQEYQAYFNSKSN